MKNKLEDYKMILNYVKNYGTSDFEKILYYYQNYYKEISKEKIIQRELIEKNMLKIMYEKSKKLFLYLKENETKISLFDDNFKLFIEELKNNLYKINNYLENIEALEKINVCDVNIYSKNNKYSFVINSKNETINSYKIKGKWKYIKEPIPDNLRKIYTDGQINFTPKHLFGEGTLEFPYLIYGGYQNYYYSEVLNYNWVLDVNQQEETKTTINLKNSFDFDIKELPSKEEIISTEIPKSLKLYYKELIYHKSK